MLFFPFNALSLFIPPPQKTLPSRTPLRILYLHISLVIVVAVVVAAAEVHVAPPDGRQVCENGSKELLTGASSTDPTCHRVEVTPFGLSGVVWGLRAHRKHFPPESGKKIHEDCFIVIFNIYFFFLVWSACISGLPADDWLCLAFHLKKSYS